MPPSAEPYGSPGDSVEVGPKVGSRYSAAGGSGAPDELMCPAAGWAGRPSEPVGCAAAPGMASACCADLAELALMALSAACAELGTAGRLPVVVAAWCVSMFSCLWSSCSCCRRCVLEGLNGLMGQLSASCAGSKPKPSPWGAAVCLLAGRSCCCSCCRGCQHLA